MSLQPVQLGSLQVPPALDAAQGTPSKGSKHSITSPHLAKASKTGAMRFTYDDTVTNEKLGLRELTQWLLDLQVRHERFCA
jgi:hypothetical protein